MVLVLTIGVSKANQYESERNLIIAAAIAQQYLIGQGFGGQLNFFDAQTQWRNPGSTIVMFRSLSPGNRYCFVASGDNNASDVDIYVYDSQGRLVTRDQHTDRNAYALFQVNYYTETFKIVVKLYSSFNNGPSHVSYAMSYY
jgi:hypothetical protein